MSFYTSSYKNILARKKAPGDFYIQVSRNLGKYEQENDTSGLALLIDENWGEEFGNWWGDKAAYKSGVSKKDLRAFAKRLRELMKERNIFLLCFEDVLAGEVCHRRWLAEILQKSFGLKVDEWNGEGI